MLFLPLRSHIPFYEFISGSNRNNDIVTMFLLFLRSFFLVHLIYKYWMWLDGMQTNCSNDYSAEGFGHKTTEIEWLVKHSGWFCSWIEPNSWNCYEKMICGETGQPEFHFFHSLTYSPSLSMSTSTSLLLLLLLLSLLSNKQYKLNIQYINKNCIRLIHQALNSLKCGSRKETEQAKVKKNPVKYYESETICYYATHI